MIVVRVISIALALFAAYGIITQVILPTWNGTRMFPWFRKGARKAELELKEIQERQSIAAINLRIAEEESETVNIESKARRIIHDTYDEMIEDENDKKKTNS